MEYVHKQTINFRDDRTPLQRRVSIGYEGDNLVERLEFVLPELVGGQTATLMITGADAITLNRVDDGRYAADLTREMIGPDGKRNAYIRIDGVSGQIWQSDPLRIVTGKLPDVEEEIEKVYPTAVGQMLTAMAEHTGEMEAQEARVERAAQRAEEAAERAETGGGSGGPGEDGGYYQPSVTDGVLTWTPSKGDMPGVPASDVRGPAGQDGKTAYQYARDGGYTGTEAEFAEKMAQEIPEPYTLPVATADTLGGVKVGDGLTADEDGRVRVDPQKHYTKVETDAAIVAAIGADNEKFELIETIALEEETLSIFRNKEPNGKAYDFKEMIIYILNQPYETGGSSLTWQMIFNGDGSDIIPWIVCQASAYPQHLVSYVKIHKGRCFYDTAASINGMSNTNVAMNQSANSKGLREAVRLTEWRLSVYQNTMRAGTTIKIYGVRNNA